MHYSEEPPRRLGPLVPPPDDLEPRKPLGSLSGREPYKHLRQARVLLVISGCILFTFAILEWASLRMETEKILDELALEDRFNKDLHKRVENIDNRFPYPVVYCIIHGLLAGFLVLCAICLPRNAVPLSLFALVFYIGVTVAITAVAPGTICHGFVWKLTVLAFLIIALTSASAHQRQMNRLAFTMEDP